MAEKYGLCHGSLPVGYLGLPLLPSKLTPLDYQPLLDKITARMGSWTVRHLSYVGRLQMLQSVIFSIINLWASIFPLPKGCLRKLESTCSAFLWKGAPNSSRGAKVSWESVCTPKTEGGLGLRRLIPWSNIFGLKLIWILFTKSGSLWVSWVKHNLIKGRLFWDPQLSNSGSWLWKKLLKLRVMARPYLFCQIGARNSALFWHDDWSKLGPLIDLTGANGPRISGIPRMATVSQAVSNGVWHLPSGRHPILLLLMQCLASPPNLQMEESDYFLWRHAPADPNSSMGQFSSSLTWRSLHPPNQFVAWYEAIWFAQRIPKHAFISWIVMRDRLPTRDKLLRWGLVVPSLCLLYSSQDENRNHLYFECSFSRQLWSSIFSHHSLNPPSSLDGFVTWVGTPNRSPKLKVICKLLMQATVYEIWLERNNRLHQGNGRSAGSVLKQIFLTLRSKLSALDQISRRSRLPPTRLELSYLSTWFAFIQHSPAISARL